MYVVAPLAGKWSAFGTGTHAAPQLYAPGGQWQSSDTNARNHQLILAAICVCVWGEGGQRSCRTFRGGNALAIFKSWPTGLFAEEGKSSVSSANSESRMWVWVPSSQELELKLELVVDSEDSEDSKGG